MKTITIPIDNLKCGGCENTIVKQLSKIKGVKNVQVSVEVSSVTISFDGENMEPIFLKTLARLGYPKQGTGNLFKKAKSYVSCAIGKVS